MAHAGKFSGGADRFGEIFDSQGKIQSQFLPTGGGAGVSSKGVWSGGTVYNPGDTVLWLGSSYIAKITVAAGGSNPASDTISWQLLASGGGELAYAEYTGVDIALATATPTDIPGAVIAVPAGSGPFLLRAIAYARAVATGANTFAQAQLIVYDIDAAATLKSGIVQMNLSVSGMTARSPIVVEVRLPATATTRNFKLQQFGVLGASVTAFISGPGTVAVNPAVTISAVAR